MIAQPDEQLDDGLEPLISLTRDMRRAGASLSVEEARFLVDAYYLWQEQRIRSGNQVRALGESAEPHQVLDWLTSNTERIEHNVLAALAAYTEAQPLGRWSRSIFGIGPVISAGLLAHIDIEKAPTVGHIWRFAGQDPTVKWLGRAGALEMGVIIQHIGPDPDAGEDDAYALGPVEVEQYAEIVTSGRAGELNARQIQAISQLTHRKFGNLLRLGRDERGRVTAASMTKVLAKRPWNARLKTLCWKAGESFVKVSANDADVYGHIYAERKALENERNEQGLFAGQARDALAAKRIGRDTDAYAWYAGCLSAEEARKIAEAPAADRIRLVKALRGEPGSGIAMLPPAHVHARAKRYAVKIFLAHYHHVAYELHYHTPPPRPYVIEHLGHARYLGPPNWPM